VSKSSQHFIVEPLAGRLRGTVRVPGDKSISHRAVIFGALADGTVRVDGLGSGADNKGTARALAALGVGMQERDGVLEIHGVGLRGLTAPASVLDVGNSGTSIRLLAGLLAAQPFASELTGDSSLRGRPMRRVTDPLGSMGARIAGASGSRPGELYPPLAISPAEGLAGIEYDLPVASAQVKSALLLAALYADGPTRLREPGPSRDHTERMLRYLGCPVWANGPLTTFDPAQWDEQLTARPISVPGDPSSAAFLVAAALVAPSDRVAVEDVCINSTRTGFLDVLESMGAKVAMDADPDAGSEPVSELVVEGATELTNAEVTGDLTVRSIDEVPILAVVAARAEGTTWFRDAAELRVKETDRIATTAAMLRAFGVEVEERPDALGVHGNGGRPLRAARVDAAGDHRIAMAAAVAGLVADGPTRIDDTANVGTSFPTFVASMGALGASIRVEDPAASPG